MNLNIRSVVIGFGSLPPSFEENLSGHLTYHRDGGQYLFNREDIHAIDRTNIDLLTKTEQSVLREIARFFACNPTVYQVSLRTS